MGLLPREASFAEEVADFFLAFRGSGVALSPLDVDLVLDWQARGVPYPVVCRGIRKAAEKRARTLRPGEPWLRSLRSCARAIDDEFKRFSGLSTGRASPKASRTPGQDRMAKARAALAKSSRQGSEAVRRAAERVRVRANASPSDPAQAAAAVGRLDEAFAFSYLRALPFEARLELLRAARTGLGAALGQMSLRARRACLRAHRVMAARAHGSLVVLR
jgi:hypothetical protein